MTRIPAVSPDEAGPLIKLSYRWAKRRFGEVPEPFAVTANHRKLFAAHAIAETAAGKASTVLPANVRDLAVYRVAWAVGCSWCVDFGAMMARLDSVVELTYQIALENLRSRMNSALGITEQGFGSGDACRVPWANETTTATTR